MKNEEYKTKIRPLTRTDFRFGDPDENRTRVTAVKGRCLNRLTTGPYIAAEIAANLVAATGLEPVTFRV